MDYSDKGSDTERLRRRLAQWRAFAILLFIAFGGTMTWLYLVMPGGVRLSHFTWILPH